MNLADKLREVEDKKKELNTFLVNKIEEIPQNRNIKPAKNRMFTIPFSEIAKNKTILSPSYYDFDTQKNILKEIINKSKNPVKALQEVVKTKKYKNTNFHPDVITALIKILNS